MNGRNRNMSKATLFRIKEGKKDVWYAWCNELATTLRSEAEETLEEEKVTHELFVGLSLDGSDYVLGYMDGECLPANMDREINQKHKHMREACLERVSEADVLYDIRSKKDMD